MTLTTLRGFAARNNWNPGYAHKLKESGRLVMVEQGDGKYLVDVEASMQLLADTADPQKDYMREVNARQRGEEREPSEPTPVDSHSASYSRARTASTVLDAQLKQLDLQTKKGVLIDVRHAKRIAYSSFRALRDAILNVPVRIKDHCAAEADAFKVEQLMEAELKAALDAFDPKSALTGIKDVDEAFDDES